MAKVLIVGSGGREHTIAWSLAKSPKVDKVFVAPGNAGTALMSKGENTPLKVMQFEELADFAEKQEVDFTFIGPDDPLAAGIVDVFVKRGLRAFGPSAKAAQLEASKSFAKKIMEKYNVPTGSYMAFTDYEDAVDYVKSLDSKFVLKADGLALGKGVLLPDTKEQAIQGLKQIMIDKKFGEAGNKVLVEEFLEGEEASMFAFSDGKNIVPLISSQDYKRALDGDQGLNTGGMGAYSPAPIVTSEVYDKIVEKVLQRTVDGMRKEGCDFTGVLYAGLMIKEGEPKTVEFNVRFGDPETQIILPMLRSDLYEVINDVLDKNTSNIDLKWDQGACCCVVMASGGYPLSYEKSKKITGLDKVGCEVFHAGTKLEGNDIFTSGGRVLGVTAVGSNIHNAINEAYANVGKINFEKAYYRKDIGHRAIRE